MSLNSKKAIIQITLTNRLRRIWFSFVMADLIHKSKWEKLTEGTVIWFWDCCRCHSPYKLAVIFVIVPIFYDIRTSICHLNWTRWAKRKKRIKLKQTPQIPPPPNKGTRTNQHPNKTMRHTAVYLFMVSIKLLLFRIQMENSVAWNSKKEKICFVLRHLEHISYWMSGMWSLWHSFWEETQFRHIGYSFR